MAKSVQKFAIEVAQGCVVTWKKEMRAGGTATIGQLKSEISANSQSFKGNPSEMLFRAIIDGEPLPDDYIVPAGSKVFAKKVSSKSTTSKSSTSKSSGGSGNKKSSDAVMVVQLPETSGAPTTVAKTNALTLTLSFKSEKDTDDYLESMCGDWDLDYVKLVSDFQTKQLDDEEQALQAQLDAIKAKKQGIIAPKPNDSDKQLEQLVKVKTLKKPTQQKPTASSSAAAVADIEEVLVSEEEDTNESGSEEDVPVTKQLQKLAVEKGIFLDADQVDKKGFKPKERK